MLYRSLLAVLLICGSVSNASAATVSLGQAGSLPARFEFWHDNKADRTHWAVVSDGGAADDVALEFTASDKHSGSFIAVDPSARATNFNASLQFKLIRGPLPSGGIVLRMTSPDNYYLVKLSAYEGRLSFIHVIDGKPDEIAGVEAEITQDHWQMLEVDVRDDAFKIMLDGRWVLTAFDRSSVREGNIGAWCENNNVTRFAGLQFAPIESRSHADLGADQTRGE